MPGSGVASTTSRENSRILASFGLHLQTIEGNLHPSRETIALGQSWHLPFHMHHSHMTILR